MKKLIAIGIIAILLSVGLSGCYEEDDEPENDILPEDQLPPRTLNGWYYVYDQHSWNSMTGFYDIYNNTLINPNIDYTLLFYENNAKTLRLKAYKDTPGDININIGTSIVNPQFTFQTSDNQLDTGEFVLDFNISNNYHIWSHSGDVYITLLQYYDNCEISADFYYIDFVRYEGD